MLNEAPALSPALRPFSARREPIRRSGAIKALSPDPSASTDLIEHLIAERGEPRATTQKVRSPDRRVAIGAPLSYRPARFA